MWDYTKRAIELKKYQKCDSTKKKLRLSRGKSER